MAAIFRKTFLFFFLPFTSVTRCASNILLLYICREFIRRQLDNEIALLIARKRELQLELDLAKIKEQTKWFNEMVGR